MQLGASAAFVRVLDDISRNGPKRALYARALVSLLVVLLVSHLVGFASVRPAGEPREMGGLRRLLRRRRMVWRGDVERAYSFIDLARVQQEFTGTISFMPWTYPPPFNLLVAPLALVPVPVAYALFTATTLAAYVAILRRIAGEGFPVILLALFPALAITIGCGQNGFLTGALIGLACLGLQARPGLAGASLGLMIVKPHLAAAFAVHVLLGRRWVVALTAVAVALAACLLATWLLGPSVWTAFLSGVNESRIFLEMGYYPLFRMISPTPPSARGGLPPPSPSRPRRRSPRRPFATVWLAGRRGLPLRRQLGLTAVASLLISPYAYDYDLPILGIGLALLMPDLARLATARELATLVGLTFAASVYGLAQTFRLGFRPDGGEIDP
jgi:hypothetical protein